jgi:hypothetical protein
LNFVTFFKQYMRCMSTNYSKGVLFLAYNSLEKYIIHQLIVFMRKKKTHLQLLHMFFLFYPFSNSCFLQIRKQIERSYRNYWWNNKVAHIDKNNLPLELLQHFVWYPTYPTMERVRICKICEILKSIEYWIILTCKRYTLSDKLRTSSDALFSAFDKTSFSLFNADNWNNNSKWVH